MPRRWEPTGRTLSSWNGLVACFEWGRAAAVDARRPSLKAFPIAGCAQWLAAISIETQSRHFGGQRAVGSGI